MKKKTAAIIAICASALVVIGITVVSVVYIVPFVRLGKGLQNAKEKSGENITEEAGSVSAEDGSTLPAVPEDDPTAVPESGASGEKTTAPTTGKAQKDGKTTTKPSGNGKDAPSSSVPAEASSSGTKPQPTKPAVTDPPAAKPTKPAVTDPPAAKPTKPAVTNPPATQPTKPTVTDPPATQPTKPAVTEPPVTQSPVQKMNEYDAYRSGHFYAKGIATEDDGTVTPLELAVDDNNVYMLSQMDGVTIGILISKGKMYMIYDNAKKYCELSSVLTKAADLDPEELIATAKESYSNLQPMSKAVRILEEKVNGYDCDTYYFRDKDGTQTTASVTGTGKLVQLKNFDQNGRLVTTMDFTTVTADIPAEKLAPPKDYKKVNMVSFMLELSEVMDVE